MRIAEAPVRLLRSFLAGLLGIGLAAASVPATAQEQAPIPRSQASGVAAFAGTAEERPLPITLPVAFRLADARAIDIAAAGQRVRVAEAVLQQAKVQWLPSVTLGADYFRHDGPVQDVSNAVFNDSHGGVMLGAGSGIGPAAVLDVGNAIFAPLVARQQLRAREADRQTASNDTLLAVAEAYFTVQQGRGELAGARETTRRTEDLVSRTRKLAPEVVPELETDRAEAELARCQQAEFTALQRWKVSGADLVRLLRLSPEAQVEPAELPHLRIELVDLNQPLDRLIPLGLTNRPELASQQAQVQATLTLLRQERLRPLIPSVLLRGASTSPSGTLAGGVYFPNPNGGMAGARDDIDVQVLWQLNNLGFGNRAAVNQRKAENELAVIDLFRLQDRVAAEIARAYAEARMAAQRVEYAGREVRSARASADKNVTALGQTRAGGGQIQLLVRPQEAVASVQELARAYGDYYAAVADSNRAQFRLYRALGQPARAVLGEGSECLAPPLTVAAPATATPGR
jgi:outer membrane protein TolC